MKFKFTNKERFFWIFLLLSVFFIQIKIPNIQNIANAAPDESSIDKNLNLFMKVLSIIRNDYVDEEKVSYKTLFEGAIKGMINALDDPHTIYFKTQENKDFNQSIKGSYTGLGIYIRKDNKKLIIINPMKNTPAWEVGLKPFDQITKIEGKSTLNMSMDTIISKLKGPIGTSVNITINRSTEDKDLNFKVLRAKIKVKSVFFDKIKKTDTGYVKVNQFNTDTAKEFKSALNKLKKQKIDSLIIDLRSNPGGLLNVVAEMVDNFIDKGKIVYTKDRHGQIQQEFNAHHNISIPKYIPIIILVDRYSASASEIFSGSMQDHKRAILIGEKTYGKFSVQQVFSIDPQEKTAFKMTIAHYYLPSGRSLNKIGITPDIKIPTEFYTKNETKIIKQINKKRIIEKYISQHPNKQNDTKNFQQLLDTLDKNNFNLDQRTIKKLLTEKRIQKENRNLPLYVLDLDPALSRALEILKAQKLLKEK